MTTPSNFAIQNQIPKNHPQGDQYCFTELLLTVLALFIHGYHHLKGPRITIFFSSTVFFC